MEHPDIKNLGLRREAIGKILLLYNDLMMRQLIRDSHVELENGFNIEIVPLTPRVHVLRGVTYQSTRNYKLKLTIHSEVYDTINEYYSKFKKEME